MTMQGGARDVERERAHITEQIEKLSARLETMEREYAGARGVAGMELRARVLYRDVRALRERIKELEGKLAAIKPPEKPGPTYGADASEEDIVRAFDEYG